MDSHYRWNTSVHRVACSVLFLVLNLLYMGNAWSQSKSGGIDFQPLYLVESSCQNVPMRRPGDLSQDVPSDMLVTRSDRLNRDSSGGFVFAGDVAIFYAGNAIYSDAILVDESNDVLRFSKPFTLHSTDVEVQGTSGHYEVDTENVSFSDVAFQSVRNAGNGRLRTFRKEGALAEIEGLRISTCSDVGTNWQLRATRLRVNDEKNTASLRNLRLTLSGIPILYLPYARISRPDRQDTGFQTPVVDFHSRRGLSIGIPYTFRINGDIPVTVIANYLSKRGPQLYTEVFKGSTRLSMTWIPADRAHNGTESRKSFRVQNPTASFERGNRWHIGLDHSTDQGPWSIWMNIDQSSDVDYWRDFRSVRHGQGILANESTVDISLLSDAWQASLAAQQFTSTIIADDQVERLPETNFQWLPRWGKFAFETHMNYASFDRERSTALPNSIDGEQLRRRHVGQTANFRHTWNAVEIESSVGYTKTWFEFDADSRALEFVRSQWTQSLNGSIRMARALDWGEMGWRQTLEPKVFLLKRDFAPTGNYPRFDDTSLVFKSQRLFTARRHSGLDYIPGAKSVTLGAETELWRLDSPRKVASGAFGWIQHFNGLNGTGEKHNQIGIDARLNIGMVGMAIQHLASRSDDLPNESNAKIGVYGSGNFLVELAYVDRSYAFTRQSSFSLQKKLGTHWFLFAHHTHDLDQKRNIDRFVGLSYDNCCLNMKWMYRESIDLGLNPNYSEVTFDRGISLQLIFKGLMSAGSNIDNLIRRKSIRDLF